MLYLDTSILVSAMTSESETERSQRRLAETPLAEMAVSVWTRTEFASALSIKVRTGQISLEQSRQSQALCDEFVGAIGAVWSVEDRHFAAAADLASQPELSLKAGDALHLALVLDHGATLVTLDERLARAAEAVG
ncbi:Ribonuclease VapC [uncultured Pleomorphomonas sp.]|uniref:Ribonuclease VapC n=1 Tax=uncultured Pleomorphomonas sp. TaxID=442121 RepID=A0A212LM26_9HYPH|nr:type II toxin-antitoxin system VapC family toxin [uncultured Pleomorphomonas sp.]SCM78591.1 Ribonuclease VapC [uncultured Pleomorphomonas sp.]